MNKIKKKILGKRDRIPMRSLIKERCRCVKYEELNIVVIYI